MSRSMADHRECVVERTPRPVRPAFPRSGQVSFDQDEDEPADEICRQVGRLNLPRYFSTWSGHLQACVQDWPSCNCGVFPAVDHDRSRT
jgi:hypothetical protein